MVKVNNDKIQEIENFITILETKILMDNDIRQSFCMISKKILIIKQILSVNNQRDFLDSMIYSLLMGIKILISDHFKQEQYDLYIRIFIEHGFKMLTDKDRNSRITVDQIREEILKQYNSSNLKKEIVFESANVRLLRILSWCCVFAAGVTLITAIVLSAKHNHEIFIYISAVAEFFVGVIVRVVKNCFEKAVQIKAENDLTI